VYVICYNIFLSAPTSNSVLAVKRKLSQGGVAGGLFVCVLMATWPVPRRRVQRCLERLTWRMRVISGRTSSREGLPQI